MKMIVLQDIVLSFIRIVIALQHLLLFVLLMNILKIRKQIKQMLLLK